MNPLPPVTSTGVMSVGATRPEAPPWKMRTLVAEPVGSPRPGRVENQVQRIISPSQTSDRARGGLGCPEAPAADVRTAGVQQPAKSRQRSSAPRQLTT